MFKLVAHRGPLRIVPCETWGFPVGKLGSTRLPVMVDIEPLLYTQNFTS